MARIFITGSADGLGQLAAKALIDLGHKVVIHARSIEREKQAMIKTPGAEDVLLGDLSSIEETKALASQANGLGKFDAIIHNAGVYRATAKEIFAVNTLAPYIPVSYTHLRAHETPEHLVCRLLLEKKK